MSFVPGVFKIQIGFTFLVPAHPGSPGKKGPLNGCVCVCVCVCTHCAVRGDGKRRGRSHQPSQDYCQHRERCKLDYFCRIVLFG